ncbi:MAG TPA: hypothetical protein VFQ22_04705 [Longimicrobiales bacterium]|nr:hypothetical protein [Longimicrobiales bacterium]
MPGAILQAMSDGPESRLPERPPGLHVRTIAHEGLLWDAYLELQDDPHRPATFRGKLRFDRAGPDGRGTSAETTVIIIEDSYEDAVAKARSLDDRQLAGLLRSALPED